MNTDIFAILATTFSLFSTFPQLRKSFRLRRRHHLPITAVTGSLLVAGSWLVWSIRTGETGALIASGFSVLTHGALLCRASGARRRSLLTLPALTVSAFAPVPVVEVATSMLAIVVLYPHLRAAWSVPQEIAATRWILEASEEALWAMWAISIAAPLVAAPNVLYVPICLIIAWRAARSTATVKKNEGWKKVFEEKSTEKNFLIYNSLSLSRNKESKVLPIGLLPPKYL